MRLSDRNSSETALSEQLQSERATLAGPDGLESWELGGRMVLAVMQKCPF